MNGNRKLMIAALIPTAVCLLLVVLGWQTFYFTTDDAFIAFRYASNSISGYGLVWNPAPFRPVEGYTSFLWVWLLKVIWSATGLQPPQVANVLSLLFGMVTLALVYRFIREMALPGMSLNGRILSGAIVFAGIIGNRTFLAWLSSGLETSLYNLLVTLWVYLVFSASSEGRGRPMGFFGLSLCAALTYLCRPEGLLVAVGTGAIGLVCRFGLRKDEWSKIWHYSPLLLVPAHLVWRRFYYGYWLPNTYYAKVNSPWPESGYRYMASFAIEYGLWLWCLILLLFLFRRTGMAGGVKGIIRQVEVPRLIVFAVLIANFSYYTFVVGGDHFEYRIYSHLIPLLFISALSMLAVTFERSRCIPAVLGLLVLVSLPIPWTHWYKTRSLETRAETYVLVQPVAHLFPSFARPPVKLWDKYQEWLIRHHVCMRHQEHKVASMYFASLLPSREDGSGILWSERAVMQENSVGILGWVLPEVAIIDRMGLSDLVIARSPVASSKGQSRMMAHDRSPPEGYVECFKPNVLLDSAGLTVVQRQAPLTDEDVRSCEGRYLALVTGR